MEEKYYIDIRVIVAEDMSEALEKIEREYFEEDHPLNDRVLELNKDIFVLSLQEITDLVEDVIKRKFWSTVNVGTKTTEELIVEILNR